MDVALGSLDLALELKDRLRNDRYRSDQFRASVSLLEDSYGSLKNTRSTHYGAWPGAARYAVTITTWGFGSQVCGSGSTTMEQASAL